MPGQTRGLAFALATAVCSCSPTPAEPPPEISLALVNAHIWTGEPARPWTDALAVSGERIVATGTSGAIEILAGDAMVVAARGQLVVPGFIDTYTRLLSDAARSTLDLSSIRTQRQLVAAGATAAAERPAGEWIIGHDWEPRFWDDPIFERAGLDAVTPNHPTWLIQRDEQLGVANAVALRHAGIRIDTPGARTTITGTETLTGVLVGVAMRQLEVSLPPLSSDDRDRELQLALQAAAARGITSVHHIGRWADIEVFLRAIEAQRLTLRIHMAVPLNTWLRLDRAIGVEAFGGQDGRGNNWLSVGAVHASLDGSLAAGTAAFEGTHDTSWRGNSELQVDTKAVTQSIVGADDADLQVLLSAVGDRANHIALDLAAELASRRGLRDRRLRIARAQHVRPTDLVRFATEHILANALPYSVLHDGRWIERQLGPELARTSFPFRTLLEAGAQVSFGSGRLDLGSPIEGIYAAVTRRTLDGLHPQGWIPTQQISVEQALQAYTTAAAYVGFAEHRTGRLTVGALADFAVVDRNLLTMPPNESPSAQVQLTVVGGTVVFDRGLVARSRSPQTSSALIPSPENTNALPEHSTKLQ